jgi:hypothetical protein
VASSTAILLVTTSPPIASTAASYITRARHIALKFDGELFRLYAISAQATMPPRIINSTHLLRIKPTLSPPAVGSDFRTHQGGGRIRRAARGLAGKRNSRGHRIFGPGRLTALALYQRIDQPLFGTMARDSTTLQSLIVRETTAPHPPTRLLLPCCVIGPMSPDTRPWSVRLTPSIPAQSPGLGHTPLGVLCNRSS